MTNNKKRGVKPEIKEEDMGVNPFVAGDFVIYVNKMVNKGGWKKNGEDWLNLEYMMERDTKVNLYTGLGRRDVVFGLKDASFKLFFLFCFKMESGKDWVWVNQTHWMEIMEISSVNTFKKALHDLVRYGFVCPVIGMRDVYWINPTYAFCGNRVVKYPNNVQEYEPLNGDSNFNTN